MGDGKHIPARRRERLAGSTVVRDPQWLPGDYEHALVWQAERHLECSGCGVPRDQAWAVYGPERQREQQQQAEQALERRLCVYCKTQEDDRSRKRSAADDPSQLFGWHWVFSG